MNTCFSKHMIETRRNSCHLQKNYGIIALTVKKIGTSKGQKLKEGIMFKEGIMLKEWTKIHSIYYNFVIKESSMQDDDGFSIILKSIMKKHVMSNLWQYQTITNMKNRLRHTQIIRVYKLLVHQSRKMINLGKHF